MTFLWVKKISETHFLAQRNKCHSCRSRSYWVNRIIKMMIIIVAINFDFVFVIRFALNNISLDKLAIQEKAFAASTRMRVSAVIAHLAILWSFLNCIIGKTMLLSSIQKNKNSFATNCKTNLGQKIQYN